MSSVWNDLWQPCEGDTFSLEWMKDNSGSRIDLDCDMSILTGRKPDSDVTLHTHYTTVKLKMTIYIYIYNIYIYIYTHYQDRTNYISFKGLVAHFFSISATMNYYFMLISCQSPDALLRSFFHIPKLSALTF